MKLVVSWGGGVNSTAMLIGMYERGIRPDHILFADTGGEKPETYSYLKRFSNWLKAHDMPEVVILANDGKHITLENECITQKVLPSLAYGWRKCSDKYKIRPQEKYCKGWPKYTKAIGFDAGEQHRALRGDVETDKYVKWFPLIEWEWNRDKCVEAIQRAGLCVPPKSACFYCPGSKKKEVIELSKAHPDLFARAVAMEQNADDMRVIKGLGRHWSWEELVRLDEAQLRLIPDPPQMSCTCSDGYEDEDDE